MDQILKYFPNLTEKQQAQFAQLGDLYKEWNEKINVISRKDIEHLYERHVLHSLMITKVLHFKSGTEVLDLGTGGGFPGIPLAILFPYVKFTLIDGTGKKIKVVKEVVEALGLTNVNAQQMRAEELKKGVKFDFVVTRAVATLDKLMLWSRRLIKKENINAIPNGLIALKGGDLKAEIKLLPKMDYTETYRISEYVDGEFFETKYVVYVQG